jgi:CBS domain containing-hemolysin-like protein
MVKSTAATKVADQPTQNTTEKIKHKQVAYSTVALTVVTLVFGELIPKSLGVSNAEMVARIMVRVLQVCVTPWALARPRPMSVCPTL